MSNVTDIRTQKSKNAAEGLKIEVTSTKDRILKEAFEEIKERLDVLEAHTKEQDGIIKRLLKVIKKLKEQK